jgi:hypothetical protein
VKKSKSDWTNRTCSSKYSPKRLVQLRWLLVERLRAIWNLSNRRESIVFTKISSPFAVQHKSSFGFVTETSTSFLSLTERESIQSFHTACDSFSSTSLENVHNDRLRSTEVFSVLFIRNALVSSSSNSPASAVERRPLPMEG